MNAFQLRWQQACHSFLWSRLPDEDLLSRNKTKQNTEHTRPSLHCRNSTKKYTQLHNSDNKKSSVYLLIDLINSLSWSATWQHKDFVEALGRSIRCGYHSQRLLRPVLPQFDPQIYQ